MRIKWHDVLLIALLLFCLSVQVVATCEGDPPGTPFCYECEDGVWVLRYFALCGQDSDCTGECHDGCSTTLCMCEIDASKCVGDCNSCLPFSGACYDNPAGCPGDCEDCIDGSCVDEDIYCGTGCQTCQNGTCVDNNDKCDGCLKCENDECVPDDSKCSGCQKCITSGTTGVCVDDNTKCNADNCETCVNSVCKVCGGDLTKKCCPDQSCVKPCELSPPITSTCDTSHNEDYECRGCQYGTFACSTFTQREYTGNNHYTCAEPGCDGDCVDEDVHCYTEYQCEMWIIIHFADCIHNPISKKYHCITCDPITDETCSMERVCLSCHKDPDDQGTEHKVTSKKCVD